MVGATFVAWAIYQQLGWDTSAFNERTQSLTLVVKAPSLSGNLVLKTIAPGAGVPLKDGDLVTVHLTLMKKGQYIVDTRKRGLPFTFEIGSGSAPDFISEALRGLKPKGIRECSVPGAAVARWNGGAYGNEPLDLTVEVVESQQGVN